MEVKNLQNIFIKILRSELNETELDDIVKGQLTSDVISALYSLVKVRIITYLKIKK